MAPALWAFVLRLAVLAGLLGCGSTDPTLASSADVGPTVIIEGSVSIEGISEERAIEYADVLVAAICTVAKKSSTANTAITAVADDADRLRRLGAPPRPRAPAAPRERREAADVADAADADVADAAWRRPRRTEGVLRVIVSYQLVEPVTSSEGVVTELATAEPFDYSAAINSAAASSSHPNATDVFASAAVTDVTAPITYFAPTPVPTARPVGAAPPKGSEDSPGSSGGSKRRGLRRSTLISLCVSTFFIFLALVLIRLAKSDSFMEELREARKHDMARVAIADGPPEKVHPVAVAVPSTELESDAKDAGFARPAELSLGL